MSNNSNPPISKDSSSPVPPHPPDSNGVADAADKPDADAPSAGLEVEEAAAAAGKKLEESTAANADHPMADAADADGPHPAPATVFRIRLKQPPSNLRHKMSVPELCRNFRSVTLSINLIFVGLL